MLDTAGKLLEKFVRPRLQAALEAAGDLFKTQYGFRTGSSTVDALREVVKAAKSMKRGNHYSRSICLLATLDVRNAFSFVRWVDALMTLKWDFQVPQYLLQLIRDYLKDRFIVYGEVASDNLAFVPNVWTIEKYMGGSFVVFPT